MKIFLYEYTCANAKWSILPESLRKEGLAMLLALLQDFEAVPDVTTVTLLGESFSHALPGEVHYHKGDEREQFTKLVKITDWTLVIAPEFNDILTTSCHWVALSNGRMLNASQQAIELTADKQRMAAHFIGNRIPTAEVVSCFSLGEPPRLSGDMYPVVIKPRYGAGSQSTYLVRTPAEYRTCLELANQEEDVGQLLVTKYVPGMPISVAFLTGPAGEQALLPAEQHLSEDGRFLYRGGSIPLAEELTHRSVALATRAIQCIPGLVGYIGVDLILGDSDAVVEINPRLTTSYIGLRRLAKTNLAMAMLQTALGNPVPIEWHEGKIEFRADG